jgi:hypothetical protein
VQRLVNYTDVEIFQAVRNVYGVEGQMLMADKAFRHLLPPLVRRLESPCQVAAFFALSSLRRLPLEGYLLAREATTRTLKPLDDGVRRRS